MQKKHLNTYDIYHSLGVIIFPQVRHLASYGADLELRDGKTDDKKWKWTLYIVVQMYLIESILKFTTNAEFSIETCISYFI